MMGDAIGQALGDGYVAANSRHKFGELRKATDGMQTAFLKTLVGQLQKETAKEFEGMPGGDIYNDMQNQVISEKLTATAHLGLSDTLFKPMAKQAFEQELGTSYGKYFQQQSLKATSTGSSPKVTDQKI